MVSTTKLAPGEYVPTGDQRIVLSGVTWERYEAELALRGESPVPRLAFHRRSVHVAKREYRATLENQQMMERFSARMSASGEDGAGALGAALAEFQESMKVVADRARDADQRQRALVRSVIDEVCGVLPEANATAIRRAYFRAAFPRVYGDRRSAVPLLEKAGDLNDLTETQRSDLATIQREFLPAYEAASERMVEINREAGLVVPGSDPEQWQSWQDRRNQLERVSFERDELSMKAVRRLKQVLTEDQVRRIPGLSAYEQAEDRDQFWFGG